MQLTSVPETRGAKRNLRAANARSGNGDGDENVGLSDIVVVEKVYAAGFEIVDVQSPAANRDRHAELMFFVALAMQRNERHPALLC